MSDALHPIAADAFDGFALATLTDADLEAIAAATWPKYGLEATIGIARAWNAGAARLAIATAAGCGQGSISTIVGRLRALGVSMRGETMIPRIEPRADEAPSWLARVIDVRRPAVGDVTRPLLGDPPPGRTPWSAP